LQAGALAWIDRISSPDLIEIQTWQRKPMLSTLPLGMEERAVQYDVAGLVVVVAGGTTGLGFAAAKQLVAQGAKVAVFSRSEANVVAALEQLGDSAIGRVGDAADTLTAERLVDAAVERWGRVDALYHVAGGSGRSRGDGPLHEVTEEGWDYTQDLNLKSVFLSNRAVLRQFMAQGTGGCIVNVSSVLGWSPSPAHFASHAYAATKAGIIGLSKAAASYYAAQNIRVNVIAPALVETPMSQRAAADDAIQSFVATKQPLAGGRMGLPSDVTGAALFLLSRHAAYITGQVLAVDGGWEMSEGQLS
jgi:NAD(P)-dependent dehydrogenase (short-subunit alcohol dehydrogenase family)